MNKYKNKKTEIDGITFASKKESRRYEELKMLENAGKISELELQRDFLLQEGFRNKNLDKGELPIIYRCDFFYYDKEKECYVVEDVKGIKTAVYKLKRKLFLKKYGDSYLFKEV